MKRSRKLMSALSLTLVPFLLVPAASAEDSTQDWRVDSCAASPGGGELPGTYEVYFTRVHDIDNLPTTKVVEQVLDFNGKYCAVLFVQGVSQLPAGTSMDKLAGTYKRGGTLEVDGYEPIVRQDVEEKALTPNRVNSDVTVLSADVYSFLDYITVPSTSSYPEDLWGQSAALYSPTPTWTLNVDGKTVTGTTVVVSPEAQRRAKQRYQVNTLAIRLVATFARVEVNKSKMKPAQKKEALRVIDQVEDQALARAKADYEAEIKGSASTVTSPFSKNLTGTFS